MLFEPVNIEIYPVNSDPKIRLHLRRVGAMEVVHAAGPAVVARAGPQVARPHLVAEAGMTRVADQAAKVGVPP